ncbi:MliC family protein [Bombella favorum]|uniref:C-type lysozyme inhibitor domain-containing protein n=1 Tax=Bombella favorum TaxID=2039164 RepID=A0ABR5ZP58_9PROT|nr:MliC family protein [Bombella favorum]MBA5725994.1 hypothetical protein [Bombella favorum]
MVSDRLRVVFMCGLLLAVACSRGEKAQAEESAANHPQQATPAQPTSPRKKAAPTHKTGNHLLIPLPADEIVGRQDVDYTCSLDEKKAGDDVRSLRTSLPAGRFTVTYLSADIMALAVLPVDGRVMVFANVVAGDGAKYVGDRYSWWAKGDEVTFAREDKEGVSFACHVVPTAGASVAH